MFYLVNWLLWKPGQCLRKKKYIQEPFWNKILTAYWQEIKKFKEKKAWTQRLDMSLYAVSAVRSTLQSGRILTSHLWGSGFEPFCFLQYARHPLWLLTPHETWWSLKTNTARFRMQSWWPSLMECPYERARDGFGSWDWLTPGQTWRSQESRSVKQ